jgi:hypothetical protein
MRKSKAWYGQVANRQANTNIYHRSVQFEDPLDLWCPKQKYKTKKKFIATNRKRKELLFLFSLHFLGAFFLFIMMMMMMKKPCQKKKKSLKTIQRFCCG